MIEENALVVQGAALGGIALSTEEVVSRASAVATSLAKIIQDKNLFIQIRDKNYVVVEGWNALGAMLGVLPRERETKPYVDEATGISGFESYVELVRAVDGVVIGGASAICLKNERNWKDKPEYAVRSMTVTRATGKAFRLGFSWIMQLAGYDATPAEEVIDAVDMKEVATSMGGVVKKSVTTYPPDELKTRLATKILSLKNAIAGGSQQPASDNDRKVLAAALGKVFSGNDENRHKVCTWLVGEQSTKNMDAATVLGLLKWMKVKTFADEPADVAILEASSILELLNTPKAEE